MIRKIERRTIGFGEICVGIIVLFSLVLSRLEASDQYVYPGGIDKPMFRWQYPDVFTMQNDVGFFSQDLGKNAFIPTATANLGWGSIWRLGSINPVTWAWLGGEPLIWDGFNTLKYSNSDNAIKLFVLENSDLGSNSAIGIKLLGGDTIAHITAYIPGFTGTPLDNEPWENDGVTFTNTRGNILLNPSTATKAIQADSGTNTIVYPLYVSHYSTATPAAGFGSGILFVNKNSTGSLVNAGGIEAAWSATGSFPSSVLHFKVNDSGSFGDEMFLSSAELHVLVAVNSVAGFQVNGTPLEQVAQTLTNKRINPRVNTISSTLSLTVNSDLYDKQTITAQASTLTINAPSGSPVDGQRLVFFIRDNGTSRTLTWNAIFRGSPPSATNGKDTLVEYEYDAASGTWDKTFGNQY